MSERFVADTCVLIDYSKDVPRAVRVMSRSVSRGLVFAHSVCILEMLEGVRDRQDLSRTLVFLSGIKRVRAKGIDHESAIQLMIQFHLSHDVGWADCLIAATCIRLGLPVVTTNDKHFRQFPGLRVVRPY